MQNLSYVGIQSYKVVSMCDVKIGSIEDGREEKLENIIQKRMKKRVGWFWNRRNMTREEAEAEVYDNIKNDIWSDECFASHAHGTQLEVCRRIKNLANKSEDDIVFLTAEDLSWIQ